MTQLATPSTHRETTSTTATHDRPGAPSKAALWTGRILSAVPVLFLLFSAGMKFAPPQPVLEGMAHLGWPERLAIPLGILELAVTIIYIIPQTAVLGAILITGYLGGATASHVRLGEAWIMPVLLGVLVWLGLYLRDPRLRPLVPLRR